MALDLKIKKLHILFNESLSAEERYLKIIEMGRALPPFPDNQKIELNRVYGCQSTLFLSCSLQEDKCFFQATADALISAGLAAILLFVYNEESPETILNTSPQFLADLNIITSLSPSRAHGLLHIYKKIHTYASTNLYRT